MGGRRVGRYLRRISIFFEAVRFMVILEDRVYLDGAWSLSSSSLSIVLASCAGSRPACNSIPILSHVGDRKRM